MPCSAITLSLATICAVVSVALLAIAFGTDNWQYIHVNRIEIEGSLDRSGISPQEFEESGLYRTRTKGLFRICYPESKPKGVELYLSPVETYCENIDYHIFNEDSDGSQFTEDEMVRLHMARSMIALFIVSFFFVFVAFWTGVAGCWRRSPGNIASTAILMLLACLFSAGGMGLWHGVEYYEEEKLKTEPWKASWNEILQDATTIQYDWSYMISWVGTGMALLAFCLFLGASQCMQESSSENRLSRCNTSCQLLIESTNVVYDWSYFIAWIGVGWTLISALLFSGASVCLRSEREREDAKNMAYLMPVYPQKQQYPSYGYGYPGPYHYGSQYGPYNY